LITFQNVHKQYGSKILYQNVTTAINPARRTGLIGPNGAGKTVLLRIIAGIESVDNGKVSVPNELSVGYLPQEMDFNNALQPVEVVLEPFKHLLDLGGASDNLASCTDTASKEYRKAARLYQHLHTESDLYGAHSLNARAEKILAGLGIPKESWLQSMAVLPGGYKMRVMLAQLLLIAPDFLLLDEPTNHLDMDSLIWLEKFLQKFKGGILVVSHDRDFLNRITNTTIEVLGGAITQYTGNVGAYFTWKEEVERTEKRRGKNISDKIAQTEEFINRFKAKNKNATQARSKMRVLERLKMELPQQRQITQTISFSFPPVTPSGSVPIILDKVKVSFDRQMVFNNLTLSVTRGDKIAVIGPNGAGKSTLLKTCMGLVKPDSGTITWGHNTQTRYYSQHRLDQLHPEQTLLETIESVAHTSDKTYLRSILGAFLFSDDEVFKKVGVLSGGEKSRLSLATLLVDPGNVLLLDEPTNHLDIQSVEYLAAALRDYQGTLIIVSHDEFFISQIVNRVLELRPGIFRDFPGTLADYRSYIEDGFLDRLDTGLPGRSAEKQDAEDQKQQRIRLREDKRKLDRALEKIERDIALLEEEMAQTRSALSSPEYAHNYALLDEYNKKLQTFEVKDTELLKEWDLLQHRLEKFASPD
jgi:ATP-binding cassette subfamily F protein 3